MDRVSLVATGVGVLLMGAFVAAMGFLVWSGHPDGAATLAVGVLVSMLMLAGFSMARAFCRLSDGPARTPIYILIFAMLGVVGYGSIIRWFGSNEVFGPLASYFDTGIVIGTALGLYFLALLLIEERASKKHEGAHRG